MINVIITVETVPMGAYHGQATMGLSMTPGIYAAITVQNPNNIPNNAAEEEIGCLRIPKRNNPSTKPVVSPAIART
jgi:hypothetical protein